MNGGLNQKGANGILAEYQSTLTVIELLRVAGYRVESSPDQARFELDQAVARVANELDELQQERALRQGDALGKYIFECLQAEPEILGLNEVTPMEIRQSQISIEQVGHQTNSGSSADLVVTIRSEADVFVVPISLKAYGRRPSSLGSKGGRASLTRMFLNEVKVSDEVFLDFFGEPGREFLQLLADFKRASREFYASSDGQAFVAEYQKRKNKPGAKVNNPLRRKEVGQFFIKSRGFTPEHRFAELYEQMFVRGMNSVGSSAGVSWRQFLQGFKFVLGMDNDILTLNAVADEKGTMVEIQNSFLSDTYSKLRKVLVPDCEVEIRQKKGSSILAVQIRSGPIVANSLSLAVWKDATIQFKLDTSR